MDNRLLWLFLFIIIGCSREEVDPATYADQNEIRPNQFTLKSETYILEPEDKETINGINEMGLLVSKDASWLDDIHVGSVLVNTASDPGDTMAYFRRVTEILDLPNNTGLRTEDVNLHEAFSRYIIDSRSSEFILTRTNPFSASVQCTPVSLKNWIGLSFGVEPNINGEITFDKDNTYFTAQYDSAGTIPFRIDMQLKDLYIDLSGTMKFKGSFEAGPSYDLAPPVSILVIAYTGLSLYVQPKAKFRVKVQGEIVSPQLSLVSGPHNFWMTYDESLPEPLDYEIDPEIVPSVVQSKDWTATASGKAEFQAGADIYLGVTGLPKFAKTGFNVFGYGTADAEQKGNFTDLQPRVGFNAAIGLGTKAFAELSFFGSNVPGGKTGWINLAGKLESPDFKADIKKWNVAKINTCTKYNSVVMFADNFQTTNEIFLTVDCAGCAGNGFVAWVNDELIDQGHLFSYNQSAIITLPPNLSLLNTIAIQDEVTKGCYLEDNFLDPSLFNANCTKFTDSRDGNSYCSVQIDTQTWMGENLRYSAGGTKGHWYLNEAGPDTLLFGRLYTFNEILNGETPNTSGTANKVKGLCPQGWHLPTPQEWLALRSSVGMTSTAGKLLKLPSEAIWPGADLPASSTFNAVSAGEYYPWHEGKNAAVSGNRYKQTTYWTSTTGQYDNSTVKPQIVLIDETDNFFVGLASLSQSTGFGTLGSIERIGYSCRCVKD